MVVGAGSRSCFLILLQPGPRCAAAHWPNVLHCATVSRANPLPPKARVTVRDPVLRTLRGVDAEHRGHAVRGHF